MSLTFTVMGATGNVGQQVSKVLLSQGHSVRALVRNTESSSSLELKNAGASLFASGFIAGTVPLGSLHADENALISAFSNVDGIFILIPPNVRESDPEAEVKAYLQLVKTAVQKAVKVKKIVFLSSWGAHHATGTGNIVTAYHLEQTFAPLASADLKIVFVRAASFFPNLLSSLHSVSKGILPSPYDPKHSISMVSTDDIGDEVAKQLVSEEMAIDSSLPLVIELAGPEDYTYEKICQFISDIVSKPVNYIQTPLEDMAKTLQTYGFPQRGADLVAGVAIGIEDGTVAFEHPESIVRGKRHLKDYLSANIKW